MQAAHQVQGAACVVCCNIEQGGRPSNAFGLLYKKSLGGSSKRRWLATRCGVVRRYSIIKCYPTVDMLLQPRLQCELCTHKTGDLGIKEVVCATDAQTACYSTNKLLLTGKLTPPHEGKCNLSTCSSIMAVMCCSWLHCLLTHIVARSSSRLASAATSHCNMQPRNRTVLTTPWPYLVGKASCRAWRALAAQHGISAWSSGPNDPYSHLAASI